MCTGWWHSIIMSPHNKCHCVYLYFAATGPEPAPLRNCMSRVQLQCMVPVVSQYAGMDASAIVQRIMVTDLRETCRYVHYRYCRMTNCDMLCWFAKTRSRDVNTPTYRLILVTRTYKEDHFWPPVRWISCVLVTKAKAINHQDVLLQQPYLIM